MLQAFKKTVTSAGTPVQVLTETPGIETHGQAIMPTLVNGVTFQALQENTGFIYIGLRDMVKATLVNVLFVLAVPSGTLGARTSIPSVAIPSPDGAANAIWPGDLFIDADVSGEGVLVSFVIH